MNGWMLEKTFGPSNLNLPKLAGFLAEIAGMI